MKIQVLFKNFLAYQKGSFITYCDYRFTCDDNRYDSRDFSFSTHWATFMESNCPEHVAADIKKDLVKAGLKDKKDFQIVVWE